jgi:predicted porin
MERLYRWFAKSHTLVVTIALLTMDPLRERAMKRSLILSDCRRAVIQRRWILSASALVFFFLFSSTPRATSAQEPASGTEDRRALEERVERLEKAIAALQAQLAAQQGGVPAGATSAGAAPAVARTAPQSGVKPQASGSVNTAQEMPRPAAPDTRPGSTSPASSGVNPAAVVNQTIGESQPTTAEQAQHKFFERKPGRDLTFYTHGGELTAYGNLDVSIETMTKGIGQLTDPNGLPPVGNTGWLPDISTNMAYIGVRGTQSTGIKNLNFIYQLETQIDISATSGISESNSAESNTVKGGLTSRNSYIGLGSVKGGAFLFGKTDAPYKQSTSRMDPFFAMIGDYAVIMGNTGGDNRVEFGTRLDHSLWYVSPTMRGFEADVLYSPGQNRSNISDNIAAGESDCTGGDIPGSGGSVPFACNDGGFSDAVSASLTYTKDPLYIVAAYERHMKVNRQSDLTGVYANVPTAYYNADVADEDAAKAGIQYTFMKRTVVSAIYENFHRYVPYFLEFQNERQRQGSWLAATQGIGLADSISFGWARAYRAPGDPGQHNTSLEVPPLGSPGDAVGGRGVNNTANMFTVAYKHRIGEGLTAYLDWAGTFNGPYAHFDLGAGGRGVTTDCHDASGATGGESSDPHCWAGGQLQGVSVGLDKRF